ncbi:MAG: LysR family transcriptional regulator [Burkholderiales bacterium]|nr:LysR family transcriptional regulator [Burkholderiales bacterium]
MHPHDLRLFLEVAELGSFTKAAAQRRTVQSRISKQISALEAACGAPLFRRTGRGVVPSELGKRIEARARAWLHEGEDLLADIRADAAVPMGEVRLGILPSAAHPLMTHVARRLRTNYPRVRLDIREGQGSELDALLDAGSFDMAILFRHQRPTGGDAKLLATASTYLVSRPGDPLTRSPNVDFARLADLPLILPRRPAHWRAVLDDTARAKGFTLRAELEADSLRMQKELVIATPGLYSLLGAFSIEEELHAGRLAAARIVNPELRRHVVLALPRQGQLTPAGRLVATLIRETVNQWGNLLAPR